MADAEPEEPAAQENPDDAVKRKFREALERKRAPQTEASSGSGGKGTSKARGTHGPAATQRSFRRKSG